MGQKQKPEVFYKVPKPPPPPSPLLHVCVLYLFAEIKLQATNKTEKKSQCRGDTYPLVNMWAHLYVTCLQSSPQARRHIHTKSTHTHRDPCSDIRKVSSPIQAVTTMTLCPEAGPVTKPVLFSEFTADLLQRAFIGTRPQTNCSWSGKSASLLLFPSLTFFQELSDVFLFVYVEVSHLFPCDVSLILKATKSYWRRHFLHFTNFTDHI